MITLDLFEQEPNFRKPVEYQNRKQFGTVNLANFIKAFQSKPQQPVQFDFPGGLSYKLSPQWVNMLGEYYNNLETQNDRAQLVYFVLTDYNKTIRLLNNLAQSKLFEKKSLDKTDDQNFKSTKLSRLKTQARAKYPAAGSDLEALAADFVDSQEADQKEFARVKATNKKQDELLKQLAAINRAQDQEIDGLEGDEAELINNIKQIRAANAELAKKLAAMSQRKQAKADAKTVNVPQTADDDAIVIAPQADQTQEKPAPAPKPTAKRKRRTKAEIEKEKASKAAIAAMAAMTKAAGGRQINVTGQDNPLVPGNIEGPADDEGADTEIPSKIDLFPEKVEEELPAKATHKLQQWKNQRNQATQQATQPVATTAPVEPQPAPARLSDLQARHQKIKALYDLKKAIEIAKEKYTKTGRQLPRGLAADLEDYYTLDDVDQHFDEMLAKYQKQKAALNQYINMQSILKKKVTHEMRASELHEDTKSEFKAVALAKIKKALSNPKLDPNTRRDFEIRLQKIQALEEGRAGYNPLTSEKHWHEVERYLASQINDRNLDPESRAEARRRYLEKRKEAQQKGWAK